jgi:predicted DNA binding CopG/RHH family protein
MNKQDEFEEDILKSYENYELKFFSDFNKLREEYESYARHTFKKKINIRISESDLNRLKQNLLKKTRYTKHWFRS